MVGQPNAAGDEVFVGTRAKMTDLIGGDWQRNRQIKLLGAVGNMGKDGDEQRIGIRRRHVNELQHNFFRLRFCRGRISRRQSFAALFLGIVKLGLF